MIQVPALGDISLALDDPRYISAVDVQLRLLENWRDDLESRIIGGLTKAVTKSIDLLLTEDGIQVSGYTQMVITLPLTPSRIVPLSFLLPQVSHASSAVLKRLQVLVKGIGRSASVVTSDLYFEYQGLSSSLDEHIAHLQQFTQVERVYGQDKDRYVVLLFLGKEHVDAARADLFQRMYDPAKKVSVSPAEILNSGASEIFTLLTRELNMKVNPHKTSIYIVKNPSLVLDPILYMKPDSLIKFEQKYFSVHPFLNYFRILANKADYDLRVRNLKTMGAGYADGVIAALDPLGFLLGSVHHLSQRPSLYLGYNGCSSEFSLQSYERTSVRYKISKLAGFCTSMHMNLLLLDYSHAFLLFPAAFAFLGYNATKRLQRHLYQRAQDATKRERHPQ